MDTCKTFSKLLEAARSSLLIECSKYSSCTEDSLDLYQRVCIKMWKSFHTYNPAYSFVTWGSRVVKTVFIDGIRRKRVDLIYTDNFGSHEPYCEPPSFQDSLEALTPEEARVLVDYYEKGMTYKEIAMERGIPYYVARELVQSAFNEIKEVVDDV